MSNPKAQAFSSKLKVFHEMCTKLASGSSNLPSSGDVIGLLKYFQSTLHGLAKDIQELEFDRFTSRLKDQEWRLQYLLQLDYGELYLCILGLVENASKMANHSAVCEHIIRTIHNLLIFLDYDCLEGLPLAVAWMLVYFPVSVQTSIMELLCSAIIPLIYNSKDDQESFAIDSIPAILTLIFQHAERVEHHVWAVESFLSKKKELHKDLLMIIAYGPTEARLPAVCLLFHYWPETYPAVFHANQTLQPVHYIWEPWKSLTCDRTDCPNKSGKALAMKMTVNPRIAAQHGGKPPPLYVCLDCADALNRRDFDQLVDILLPSKQISLTCESKTCRSKNNQATVTCWSTGCTFLTGNRAIRFCDTCHTLRHSYGQSLSGQMYNENESVERTFPSLGSTTHPGLHIYQMPLPDVWDMALDLQSCMVEALVSLTRETMPRWRQVLLGPADGGEEASNRAVAGLTCTGPNPPGGPPTGGDMMLLGVNPPGTAPGLNMVAGAPGAGPGALTANMSSVNLSLTPSQLVSHADFGSGQQGSSSATRGIAGVVNASVSASAEAGELSLTGRYADEDHKFLAVYGALLVGEKCKPRECVNIYILKWIQEVQRLHPEAVFAVLLPHPLEYARVGSCWDALCDRTTQVKHGLSRIGSLIPYDIVTFETWDFVMPYWLETIRTEVPRPEYFELEILLKKIFDATAGPFPFLPQKVYHFAAERFSSTPVSVQDQALSWLEILTSVEVPIPMKELLTMFRSGVEAFQTEIILPTLEDESDGPYSSDDDVDESARHLNSTSDFDEREFGRSRIHDILGMDADLLDSAFEDQQTPISPISPTGQRSFGQFPSEEEEEDDQTPDETRGLLTKRTGQSIGSTFRKVGRPSRTKHAARRSKSSTAREPSISKTRESSVSGPAVTQLSSKSGQSPQPVQATGRSGLNKRKKGTPRDYRMTDCLAQMLNIAYRQLKIHDPLGHGGFNQETPQLLLSLLGDMLQLYWGEDKLTTQSGLRCTRHGSTDSPPTNSQPQTNATISAIPVNQTVGSTEQQSQHQNQPQQQQQPEQELSEQATECLNCLDMLAWFTYADLVCQHLAPTKPSPKTATELTVEALNKAAEFPEYTDWKCVSNSLATNPTNTELGTDQVVSDSDQFPSSEYLSSLPPVLRVVYLLIRFLHTPPTSQTDPTEANEHSTPAVELKLKPDGPYISSDPIVLQCIIEILVYLCHIGDCLQYSLTKAVKEKDRSVGPTSSSVSGSTQANPVQNITRARLPSNAASKVLLSSRLSNTSATGSQIAGGASLGGCTASPDAQMSFIYYMVHCHLIPSLWGLLKSELSYLACWVVPLLLHCLNMPGGPKVMWRLVERDFGHTDWRVRFGAIEKVTVLMRELDHSVLSGGFSGSAGQKIASILSGGSLTAAGGVNLFGRTPASGPSRARGGRGLPGKPGFGVGRSHGANVAHVEGLGKMGTAIATNDNPLLWTALAHAFCCLIGSLDDSNSIIAQYTATHLSSLNNTALSCGIQCLEFQFDTVVADRCLILQRMHQLSCTLPDRKVFTWDFFVNRFGLLALQAQMGSGGQSEDIDNVTDLNGYHRNSQHFQNQFERACFAAARSKGLKSISQNSRAHALRTGLAAITSVAYTQPLAGAGVNNGQPPASRPESEPGTSGGRLSSPRHGASPETAGTPETPVQTQAPRFRGSRRSRMSMASLGGIFTGSMVAGDFMDGSNKFLGTIRNSLDQDSQERDTLHQWVRLLLKFMSTVRLDTRLDEGGSGSTGGRHNPSASTKDDLRDRKALSKAQRHLAFLLGYSDGAFGQPPHKMRNSTVFHSFIAHVSGVLDRNFSMGSCILHQTLVVLQFCASPQRYATDTQPPTFTLRLLEPQVRLHWLQTLLVILYKYDYDAPGGNSPSSSAVGGGVTHSAGSMNNNNNGVGVGGGGGGGLGGGFSTNTPGPMVRLRKSSSDANLLDLDENGNMINPPMGSMSGTLGPNIGTGGSSGGLAHTQTVTTNLPSGGTRGIVEYLIQIVLNTMDAQVHVCRERTEEDIMEQPTPPVRMREVSTVSGDFKTILETDTPPASPKEQTGEDAEGEAGEVVMPGVTVTVAGPELASALTDDTVPVVVDSPPTEQLHEKDDGPSKVAVGPVKQKSESQLQVESELLGPNSTRSSKISRDKQPRHAYTDPSSARSGLELNLHATQRDKPFRKNMSDPHSSTLVYETSEVLTSSIPSTVSRDEQAIIAPVLPDGIEMSVLHEGKNPSSVFTSSPMVEDSDSQSVETSPSTTRAKVAGKGIIKPYQARRSSAHKDGKDTAGTSTNQSVLYLTLGTEMNEQQTVRMKRSPTEHPKLKKQNEISDSRIQSSQSNESDSQTTSAVEKTRPESSSDGQSRMERKKASSKKSPSNIPSQTGGISRSGSASNVAMTAAATAILSTERCPWCHQILERYDESTLGLGMLCLATFVHREPSLAAPYLRDMLLTAARLANATLYSWQPDLSHVIVPGNVSSIARQFLRCTLCNLAPNGLFFQLFQTPIPDEYFFKCIITVLVDFEDHMSFFQPILLLMDALNKRKTLPTDTFPIILENLASYLEYLPNLTDDVKMNHFIASGWADIIGPLETFFRKLPTVTPVPTNLATTVRIMTYILRSPVASNFKTLPDTFCSVLRLVVENVHFRLSNVIELCSLSNRTLKERTKIQLSKCLVELLYQAIKFRISIPDENLMKLLQFVLMDAGGTVEPNQVVEGLTTLFNPQTYHLFSTAAAELMRPHMADCIAFISDVHTMHKVKQAQKAAVQLNFSNYGPGGGVLGGGSSSGNAFTGLSTGGMGTTGSSSGAGGMLNSGVGLSGAAMSGSGTHGTLGGGGNIGNTGFGSSIPSLHEDVLGAHLKSGLAQYVSLELSRSSSSNDQDVLPLLAPGLLSDIRPVKATGFAPSGARLRPPTIQTSPPGFTAGGGGGPPTLHVGELHPARSANRSTGSIISKQSDDSLGEKQHRPADTTLIVITPSADSAPPKASTVENEASCSTTSSTPSGSGPGKIPCPASPSASGKSCSITPEAPSATLPVLPTPGGPAGALSRLTTYGHVTLAPTFSQTSQADAPVLHHLPWLKSIPPSSQLGPRDFLIMVERVRTLSWILLGATMNMALTREATGLACRPIPFLLVRSVADLVKALLSSFPDQQKQSVTVMSSLFHAFLLCQLWTVYCEAAASLSPSNSTQHKVAIATAVDFWSRIMPTVLRLLSISEDYVIVSGRLLSVIEELIECQCSVVTKLFPIWIPMLCGRHRQLPGNMLKRLQKCIEWEPPEPYNRLLLLLSIPDQTTRENGKQNSAAEQRFENTQSTATPSMPGVTTASLLACQANTLMGCNPMMKSTKGQPEEGIPVTGGVQCSGHALASSAPYASDGVGTGVGIGAGALGADMLNSRLVAWLKKHIFVLGRNEDQHSTATHIFVH